MTPRDTEELVEAVRAAIQLPDYDPMGYGQEVLAALTEFAERLEAAERRNEAAAATIRKMGAALDKAHERGRSAERDLASTNAAALLLHKRVEELEKERSYWRLLPSRDLADLADQLAERDKSIEGLVTNARRRFQTLYNNAADAEFVKRASYDGIAEVSGQEWVALADPVVVPGWDDGTWNQRC